MSKRIVQLLSVVFGLLGFVGCVVAIVAAWSVHARVNQASESVFDTVDNSLGVVQQRVAKTEQRIKGLRITAEDIESNTKDWAKAEARQYAGLQLGLEEKAEQFASGLQQAEHWLEVTQSSTQLIQRSLDIGKSLGVPVQTGATDRLLEEITSMQAELTGARESIETILARATQDSEETVPPERRGQIVKLAARALATLSSVDSRFGLLGDRLTEIRTKAGEAKTKATWWIRILAIGITFLIGWMTAGQAALCCLGWRGLRKRHSVSDGE